MTQLPLTHINHSLLLAKFLEQPQEVFPESSRLDNIGANPVVVTGQQVGLLGGPLYTLLKIRTAVQVAHNLTNKLGTVVKPVFWLEDNDHDSVEASTAWVADATSSLSKHVLVQEATKHPVGSLRYTADQTEYIHSMLQMHHGRYASAVVERLGLIYQPDTSWSNAFEAVLKPYLDAWNVTVVRATDVVANGRHAAVVQRDIESNDVINAVVESSRHLESLGFAVQANPGSTVFFLDVNGERQRIHRESDGFHTADGRQWSAQELLQILSSQPERFTPTVLGRPLVQDLVLNNVCSVLGVAELSYHAQLVRAYAMLGQRQPGHTLRHHALLLDSKTERLLEKLDMQPEQFFRSLEQLEHETVATSAEPVLNALQTKAHTDALVAPFFDIVRDLDQTLVKSVEGAASSIEATLDVVRGKIRTAIKRKETERIDRIRSVWWSVYPHSIHAERVTPLSVYESLFGFDGLRIIVEFICTQPNHLFTITGANRAE